MVRKLSSAGAGTVIVAVLILLLSTAATALAGPPEIMERNALRVCADGNNMPFTSRAGEGFENKIAEMMAEELGLPISYTWSPQIMGFVRNTLQLRVCDVIIGVVSGYQFVQNTNPYYRSVYSIVLPHDSPIETDDLTDPVLAGMTIGAVADTPPMVPLRRNDVRIQTYARHVDTRAMSPARDAVAHVAQGRLDAAVVWGPIAGYYAKRHDPPLKVVPLDARNGAHGRQDFRITMGIRRNEPLWMDWINDFILRHQDEIDELLREHDVPLLDARGELVVEPQQVKGASGQ